MTARLEAGLRPGGNQPVVGDYIWILTFSELIPFDQINKNVACICRIGESSDGEKTYYFKHPVLRDGGVISWTKDEIFVPLFSTEFFLVSDAFFLRMLPFNNKIKDRASQF